MFTKNPYLLALLGGALFALAYRVPGAWFVSFVALIPLLMASREVRSAREAFFAGTLAGIAIMGTGCSWFFAAYPLPTVFGVTNSLFGLTFIIFSWTLVTLSTAVCVGFWMMLVRLLRLEYVLDGLAVAVLWPAFEYLRMFTFNALTFAQGIHNPLFFTAGFSAVPLIDNESWRQVVAYGGLPMLAFLLALANVLIYGALRTKQQRLSSFQLAGICAVLIIVSVLPTVALRQMMDPNRSKEAPVTVALLSSWAPDTGGRTLQDDALTITNGQFVRHAVTEHADIVLMPEDSHLLTPFSLDTLGSFTGTTTNSVFIDSGLIKTSGGLRFVRAYADTITGDYGLRDKLVLTPQGEYLPFFFKLLLQTLGATKEEERFTTNRNYGNGIGHGSIATAGNARASVLFCLEVMMPRLGVSVKKEQGANILLVPASHGWFQPSVSLEHDIIRFSQLQAVESGLPLASSVIHGPAFAMDKYGRLITSINTPGVTTETLVTVPVIPTK